MSPQDRPRTGVATRASCAAQASAPVIVQLLCSAVLAMCGRSTLMNVIM